MTNIYYTTFLINCQSLFDKILFEWNKKGFKTMADINNHLEKRNTIKKEDSELFDYNWLDDED